MLGVDRAQTAAASRTAALLGIWVEVALGEALGERGRALAASGLQGLRQGA